MTVFSDKDVFFMVAENSHCSVYAPGILFGLDVQERDVPDGAGR